MSHAAARPTKAAPMGRSRIMPASATAALVAACLLGQTGCTTALTTAALRDALWSDDHAAEAAAVAASVGDAGPNAEAAAAVAVEGDIAADREAAERRQAAITEAVDRLAHLGALDPATQSTLVETLQGTQQEDWPVVIEAFAATLTAAQRSPAPAAETSPPAAVEMETTAVDAAPEPVAPEPEPADEAQPPAAAASAAPAAPVAEAPPPAAPALAVRHPCFASKVQAWGVVDRLPADRLAAGGDVIVYFELEGLTGRESAAGITTCIDTTLRLVAEDGREIEAWTFDPIAETCIARRRDYFARYVVRLPAKAAGGCRLEIAVTDTIAGTTATATVPCAVE